MLQIILTLLIFVVLVIPVGKYMYCIAAREKTFGDPLFNRIDNLIYKFSGIDNREMSLKQYLFALITSNVVMMIACFIILKIQGIGLFNPNGVSAMGNSLAFNTIISFMTNTNLQHYAGESGLSYLSQMAVITFMMFTSAATGYAACMAFIRGVSGSKKTMGNFYRDIVRIITRVLLPAAFVISILLVSQGVPQTLSGTQTVTTIEGSMQDLAMGPVASLESIKHIGTNGGGFFGSNSATPFENPTIGSNIIEIISMMMLPGACVVAFGFMIANRKKSDKKDYKEGKKQARAIFLAMSIIFVIGLSIIFIAENAGNPAINDIGISQSMGNMEGKELRFGVDQSSLFTAVTTAFTTGSVNNMHDSLTPIGGLIALLNMMLNVVFGGKGVGLMNMVLYAILAVFICGLMIGRTPEYLGKKIEGREMKLATLGIIVHPLLILGFSALAVLTASGIAGITNPGYHGLTQIIYEYASSAANNGSGFEGLADNNAFFNITTGLAMFFGRYVTIILQLTIASSLAFKNPVNETMGTLKTNNMTFTIILVVIVMIFAALTFLPTLSLGPIAEHLKLWL